MLKPPKGKNRKNRPNPKNPQPKGKRRRKGSGVEAIEKDLIKARENDNEVQKPSLPFAPEEINPQNGNYTDEYPEAEGTASASSLAFFGNYTDEYPEAEGYMKNSKNKKIIIAVVAVIVVVAIAVGIYFGVSRNKKEPETTTEPTTAATTAAPVIIKNPLTGEVDYNDSAVGKRPVAVVVENSPQARPQYNMDSPDIIVEGEVEGGITRMLWLYADMTDLPEQVGPTRSARPSFVQFSQFFDCIYIHFRPKPQQGRL